MMPLPDDLLPEMAQAPFAPEREATFEHPFVCRLLELGLPRLCPGDQDKGSRRILPPARRLENLSPASKTALAEINPPPLPQAFLALRRVVEDPMSGVADVAKVVAMDPGLTSYVLRLANSAFYNLSTRVETVERAVTCIGLQEIQTMALGAMLGKVFKEPPQSDLLLLPEFWRHAVSVGLLARALAERIGARGRDRFFVAGLLHDLGRLLLAIAEPDLATMTLARAVDDATALDVAERLLLGFDHAALGGRVCWKWQLPDSLTEAVSYHHDPSQSPDNTMTAAVHMADFMANALGLRCQPATEPSRLDMTVLTTFGLTEADPPLLLDALEAGLESMTALFTV